MTTTDAAKLPVMLTSAAPADHRPALAGVWRPGPTSEGWGGARFLAALCEHELAERAARRIARHLAEVRTCPPARHFATFDFAAVPSMRKAQSWRAGRRRRLARAGRQHPDLWAERHRQDACRRGDRRRR